ncbi:MAG: PEP-CTERM sorting domain-containing protein [Thermoguttaceae bacterium]|jgi:probable HAF family extracellular repeat protein
MRNRLLVTAMFGVACGWAGGARGAPPVSYSMTDLGTLGGTQSQGLALNNLGQVTGDALTGGNACAQAFLYTPSAGMQSLGSLGAAPDENSWGYAVNGSGVVVGITSVPPADQGSHGFTWSAGTGIVDLGTLPGDVVSDALSINASGTVVGGSSPNATPLIGYRAVMWTSNGIVNLDSTIPHPAGITLIGGIVINDAGAIAANGLGAPLAGQRRGTEHAYYVPPGGAAQDVGSLGGDTQPNAMNQDGEIAGQSILPNGDMHAVAWTRSGGLRDLGTLGGDNSSANGVNSAGWVVGSSEVLTNGPPYDHAFVDVAPATGPMIDLNSLVPPSGWTLSDATGINDQNQIVCTGLGPSGDEHAFILTPNPTPEPSTYALLGTAVAGLAGFAALRRQRPRQR